VFGGKRPYNTLVIKRFGKKGDEEKKGAQKNLIRKGGLLSAGSNRTEGTSRKAAEKGIKQRGGRSLPLRKKLNRKRT